MSASPIRCRGPWKVHKRSSEPDRWLDEMGFFRKHTARDSSCLFRAVSENIYNTQRYFHKVRLDCVQFMTENNHLFEGSLSCPFENYVKEMSNPSEWGGLIEITAMSHLYRRDFVIFEANKGPQTKICNGYGTTIFLFYSPETKHFDAVYNKEYINISSFCQSLVYEILYDGVYQLKDLPYAVDKMLHDKVPSNHIEYFMAENVERRKKQKERAKIFIETTNSDDKDKNKNAVALKCKHHTDDLERASLLKESLSIFVFNRSLIQLENVCMNCLNVNSAKDLLDNGITPFPYKVAKALDPDIYRNIEFDVWSELRRELRYGARYSDGTTLQVGVKCLCKLQPEQSVAYHCHIQEMHPDGGPCLVFIEELGEKRMVNYEQLEPLPSEEVRPWAPPYRYSRANSQFLTLSQMLQQIGNITRKQGLKSRSKTKTGNDEPKGPEKTVSTKSAPKLQWKGAKTPDGTEFERYEHENGYSTYQHLDFVNFEPMPVDVRALPLTMDNRPPAGAASHDLSQASTSNGSPAQENNHNNHVNQQAGGDAGNHGVTSPPVEARPAPAPPTLPSYAGHNPTIYYCEPGMPMAGALYGAGVGVGGAPVGVGGVGVGGAPPYGYVKPMWYSSPHGLQPLPSNINPNVPRSLHADGSDLPMHDLATLRFFFNLGLDCMWASMSTPQPPPQPPRLAYPARDLAQDMQQMSIQERPAMAGADMNHKRPPSADKQGGGGGGGGGKGNGQRTVMGPRFHKRNENNQNGGHNSHSNHNNHHNQKGRNNNSRRNSERGGGAGNGHQLTAPPPPHAPPPPQLHPHPHAYLPAHPAQHPPHPPHAPHAPPAQYPAAEADAAPEPPMVSLPYHIAYPPPTVYHPMQYMQYAPVEPDHGMLGMMPYLQYEEGLEYAPQPYYPPAPGPSPYAPPPAGPPHAGGPPPPAPHHPATPDTK